MKSRYFFIYSNGFFFLKEIEYIYVKVYFYSIVYRFYFKK